MQLGSTIKRLRTEAGLTQKALSKQAGVAQSYLSQIENNRREPQLGTLKKICAALEVPVPVLTFLSLEIQDVSEEKKDAYKSIFPVVKSLIEEGFLSDKHAQLQEFES